MSLPTSVIFSPNDSSREGRLNGGRAFVEGDFLVIHGQVNFAQRAILKDADRVRATAELDFGPEDGLVVVALFLGDGLDLHPWTQREVTCARRRGSRQT